MAEKDQTLRRDAHRWLWRCAAALPSEIPADPTCIGLANADLEGPRRASPEILSGDVSPTSQARIATTVTFSRGSAQLYLIALAAWAAGHLSTIVSGLRGGASTSVESLQPY